ncbi:MAG: hypothetical protein ACP5LO_00260 [Calditerrivibrio sp.]|uniref:hypothetical protein n=1 Tax=Calditerrivibrio sp. TaxID=2792612 RepID=UPI003D13F80E
MVNEFNTTSLAEISQGRLFMYSSMFKYIDNVVAEKDQDNSLIEAITLFDSELYSVLSKLDKSLCRSLCLTEIDIDIKPSETPILINNLQEYFYYENYDYYYKDKPDHLLNYLHYMIYKIYNSFEYLKENDIEAFGNNLKYQIRFLNVHLLDFLSKRSHDEIINLFLNKLKSLIKKDCNVITDDYIKLYEAN